ncbi:ORM1-like protein 1 [Sycon ciliatum]|uniref:ORM1-like protein 1 n=1 Tax=Sycon ciliatum TaxID=27933 RepID=UPI0020AA5552|eukprot:scpid90182/ scgid19602/ ORM1-like protein 3
MNCERRSGDTENPNESWLSNRGAWFTWVGVTLGVHFCFLCLPPLSTAHAWTLTNAVHTAVMFFILHMVKGSPFGGASDGEERYLTHWEQIDGGKQFTATKKFLTAFPVVLFLLASFYTSYEFTHFVANLTLMLLAVIPKLPQLHGVRLFGINKY